MNPHRLASATCPAFTQPYKVLSVRNSIIFSSHQIRGDLPTDLFIEPSPLVCLLCRYARPWAYSQWVLLGVSLPQLCVHLY